MCQKTRQQTPKRGRKAVVTPERVQLIFARCWRAAKASERLVSEPELVSRPGMLLSETAQICASVLHRLVAIGQGFDMRSMRQLCMRVRQLDRQRARRFKPQPTHQAKLVVWYLTTRVPLNLEAIPETEIVQACEWSNFPIETWQRQERTFGLLQKVYAKRAAICGQQQCQTPAPHSWTGPMLEDSQNHYL